MSKRLQSGDVTETLIKATEKAGEMEATDVLVILYNRTEDVAKMNAICSDGVTIEMSNWMCDKLKNWMLNE